MNAIQWSTLPQRAAVNEDASLYSYSYLKVYKKIGHFCPESCVTVAAQLNSCASFASARKWFKKRPDASFFPREEYGLVCSEVNFSWDARGCYGERAERLTLILQMNDLPYRKRQIIALVLQDGNERQ